MVFQGLFQPLAVGFRLFCFVDDVMVIFPFSDVSKCARVFFYSLTFIARAREL